MDEYKELQTQAPQIDLDHQENQASKIKQYKMIAAVFFCLFVICLVLLSCAIALKFGCNLDGSVSKATYHSETFKFIHASDSHLDLNYNRSTSRNSMCRSLPNTSFKDAQFEAPFGRVGCDAPISLLKSWLSFARSLSDGDSQKFKFFLFTGDQAAHDIEHDFPNSTVSESILKSIKATCHEMGTVFPDIPILPSVGNLDLPNDKVPQEGSKFYEKVLDLWKPLILCSKCPVKVTTEGELKTTFLVGGYYKAEFKDIKLTLLQVNSNYWVNSNPGAYILAIADAQMAWLAEKLKEAAASGNKVIITGHKPPGIDHCCSFKSLWATNYTTKYIELVAKIYKDVVVAQLYGHIHKDDMRLQMLNDKVGGTDRYSSFLLTAPAVSPMYRNNPGFRVVTFDVNKRMITDYHQFYMDLVLSTQNLKPIWLFDYSFSDKYMGHLSEDKRTITARMISEIVEKFVNRTNENRHWQNYIQHRQVNYQPDPFSRYVYYCAAKHVTKKTFDECVKQHPVTGG